MEARPRDSLGGAPPTVFYKNNGRGPLNRGVLITYRPLLTPHGDRKRLLRWLREIVAMLTRLSAVGRYQTAPPLEGPRHVS